MKFLVIDDEKTSSKILEHVLQPFGEVTSVASSEEGYALFLKGLETGKPFEAICLDINLPGMDGLQLLEEIRRAEEQRGVVGVAATKVFMTTASCDIDSYSDASAVGCTSYLCKPISRQKLIAELHRLGIVSDFQ